MKLSMKAAVACYGLGCAIGLFMAARYWTASEFMPYHAMIVGGPWESLSPGVQRIVLGMLKVMGSGFFATTVVVAALIVPVTRGEDWARWTSLASSCALLLPLVYLTAAVRIDTGAPAPVVPSVAALAVAFVAFVAAGAGRQQQPERAHGTHAHRPTHDAEEAGTH